MATSTQDAERFAALFAGYSKAYGTYAVRGTNAEGKAIGKPQTLRGTASLEHYQNHLDGKGAGLGVIMLREDNTVYFGAIDYDKKTMDHVKAEARVRELGLPLVLCRSKSGGGHFYCFTGEPVFAAVMRDRLDEWKAMMRMSTATETFPKQTARFNETDVGNWINLPYYDVESTVRHAYIDGKVATLQEFLAYAESKRQSSAQMGAGTASETALFDEGPPCLQTLEASGGFVEGTKKDGMFNVGVYLKKKNGDHWAELFEGYNKAMAELKSDEVQGLLKQLSKKDYSYKCKLPPISSCCNRRLCRERMYGVGATDSDDSRGYALGALTRYESPNGDDPLYAMEIDGKRILVTTAQLYSRDEFNRAAMAQANVIPVHMTPQRWLKYLNEMLPTAEIVPLPEDAGPTGQLWEHIEMFLTQQVMATDKDKIVLGQPYKEGDTVYFTSVALFKYLDARRIKYESQQKVWDLLRKRGGDKKFWVVSGKGVNVWHLPAPTTPTLPE